MRSTRHTLRLTAHIIIHRGRHTGEQFADPVTGRVDICAGAYLATGPYDDPEHLTVPDVFYTDEVASIRLIQCSAPAMAAIRAISDVLDTEVCETEVEPGTWVPDYIEHVSHWAATPPLDSLTPPTTSEVIARIFRAADTLTTQTPASPAA